MNVIKLRYIFFLAIFVFPLFLGNNAGCATASPQRTPQDTVQTLKQFLQQYEKTFNPSLYEIPITIARPDTHHGVTEPPYDMNSFDSLEFTSGYRVQALTTQEIDEANILKDSLAVLLPTEWTYIVYHSPYYKVRVGNFTDRPAANRMMRLLQEKGFLNAWVVPEQVIKNPPVRLPPVLMPVDTLE